MGVYDLEMGKATRSNFARGICLATDDNESGGNGPSLRPLNELELELRPSTWK